MPLPIWRRVALKGGDVTLHFVPVEEVKSSRSVFPAAHVLPMGASIGGAAERPAAVEFASYVQVAEEVRQVDLRSSPGEPNISTAAMDDPGPVVSASRFSRADLPVFLLKKLDGTAETLP